MDVEEKIKALRAEADKLEATITDTYIVGIKMVYTSYREVEATSPKRAIELAEDEEESFREFSHTLDKETWSVEKDPDEMKSKYDLPRTTSNPGSIC